MKTNRLSPATTLNRLIFKGWTVCGIALVSFAAGLLITTRLSHLNQVRADSNRVFELRVYHAVPGKLPELESQFRDITSKLLAKHDLKAVGYWVPEGTPDWDNTFIYLVAHASQEAHLPHFSSKSGATSGGGMSWDECRSNYIRKKEEADGWQGFQSRFMQLANEEEQIERAAPKDRLLRAHCDYHEHPEI